MLNNQKGFRTCFQERFCISADVLISWGSLLCVVLVFCYCLWILDRGLDITDESYYVLLAMHANAVSLYISAQQWLTNGIWQITGSLPSFRFFGFVILLISSSLFCVGTLKLCLSLKLVKNNKTSKVIMFAGSVIGAFMYVSTINLSPSYNLLASAGAYGATGAAFLAISCRRKALKNMLYFLAGCGIGIEIVAKPSSGIATLALIFLWIMILEDARKSKILNIIISFLGLVLCALLLLMLNTTFFDARQAFQGGMELFRMVQVEPIASRLLRYGAEFLQYLHLTIRLFLVPIVFTIFYFFTKKAIFIFLGLTALVLLLLLGNPNLDFSLSLTGAIISEGYLFGGFKRYDTQIIGLFAMLLMIFILSSSVWLKGKRIFALFLGLFLLPYTVALGTGNTIFTQVIASFSPWGLLVGLLMVAHYSSMQVKGAIGLLGLFFIITMTSQIITSALRPYHMPLTLYEQNLPITIPSIGSIKVDKKTYEFVTSINAAVKACNISPGATFLGLYNIPGVSLLLQALPPFTPWLNNREQAEVVLENASIDTKTVLALQLRGGSLHPSLPRNLDNFPKNYQLCGGGMYPFDNSYGFQYIQIWKLRSK